jgi:adenylate cyclase
MRLVKKMGRITADAGRSKLLLTFVILCAAVLIAVFSWDLPLIRNAERSLYDLRMTMSAPLADQDERIVMVVFNDKTLIDTRKRSPLDRSTLARALTTLDGMGAKSIGIDILIDQPQDEDPELLAAFKAMRTPTWLAYANIAQNEEGIIYQQQQFLDGFMDELRGSRVKPASIRLQVDTDGVERSWPTRIASLPPMLVEAMGSELGSNYTGSIRYRLPKSPDRPVFSSFPVDLFADPDMAPLFQDEIRGRHVLVGGDIVNVDQFETPMTAYTGKTMIGLEVHANLLAQMMDGAQAPPLPRLLRWGIAFLAVAAGSIVALTRLRWWQLTAFFLGQTAFFGGLPFFIQAWGWDTQFLPAIGWIIAWYIAFAAVGSLARAVGAEQRRFAQSALGKYLPGSIADKILEEPESLSLQGENRNIFVVFSDLEGFTKLSHAIKPEMVALLLNRYLDALSEVVLSHGGTLDKFVGDAVVAFWGAPIASEDDGMNAAKAAYAMWQAGEAFRSDIPDGVPPIGKTRVGLHYGEAIVGNFGGEGRFQYTALGDSMNTAARLEAANKKLCSSVMASREAAELSGLDWWRPMGKIVLRGRSTPVDIFEPAPDFPLESRKSLKTAMDMLTSDRHQALLDITKLVDLYPDDTALQHLLMRLNSPDSDAGFVMG